MPGQVNYKIESFPVEVNSGQNWGLQDIGFSSTDTDALSYNNYTWTPDNNSDNGFIPLKMILSPIEPTEYTVSAANFNIAGEPYTELEEAFNGFTWYVQNLPPNSLPSGVNKVVFTDTGIPGTVSNKVQILAWIDPLFLIPNIDFILKIDIDGDADKIIVPPEPPVFISIDCPEFVNVGESFDVTVTHNNIPESVINLFANVVDIDIEFDRFHYPKC